jgi:maleate isomerase
MMSVAYAPDGLLGVLTPQANTTVEPELALLMPRGTAWINGRLMSGRATIADRLRDYFRNYAAAMEQFANAPVGAVAFACTGASYLAGVAKEDATIAEIEGRHGIPVLTAATAVADALRALGAARGRARGARAPPALVAAAARDGARAPRLGAPRPARPRLCRLDA